MIGNESEEGNVDVRTKMEKQQVKRLNAVLKAEGIKAVIRLAAADIVTLKIQLARAELVKPTKLDPGTPPDLGPNTKTVRG